MLDLIKVAASEWRVRASSEEAQFLPSMSFCIINKSVAQLYCGLPSSYNVIKKIPSKSAQKFGFQLIPSQAMVPTRMSHHSN